jgi:hemerythrin superfamily protein
MPTASTHTGKATPRRAASRRPSAARSQDAVALLKADHRAVEKLFAQFGKARAEARKQQLAEQICLELKVHTELEEEIFYPVSRDFLKDDEIVNEALVEHQAAKDLIAQIEGLEPFDEMYDAKVTVLQELVEHHVREEEKELFPQVQKSAMDLKAVGERMKLRKDGLMREMSAQAPAMH